MFAAAGFPAQESPARSAPLPYEATMARAVESLVFVMAILAVAVAALPLRTLPPVSP